MSKGKRGAQARPVAKSRAVAVVKAVVSGTTPSGGVTDSDGASGPEPVPGSPGPARGAGKRDPAASGVKTLVAKRARRRAPQRTAVPWSEEREAIFLETLGQTCSVTNAVKASGLSSAAIYRRRNASDTFRAAWAQALREAYTRLETELLGRALNGVRKPVWHGGRRVGSVVEYSDRLALAMLARYRETCRGSAQAPTIEGEARVVLIEALARMNRGMGGEG
jgi:hypothetical protein